MSKRNTELVDQEAFRPIRSLSVLYAVATFATLGLLIWKRHDAAFATSEAWTHAVIVCVFAVVLLSLVRRASNGVRGAFRRLQIVSIILPIISLVEAVIPGLFPLWMRVEQLLYAGLLLVIALLVRGPRLRTSVQ